MSYMDVPRETLSLFTNAEFREDHLEYRVGRRLARDFPEGLQRVPQVDSKKFTG